MPLHLCRYIYIFMPAEVTICHFYFASSLFKHFFGQTLRLETTHSYVTDRRQTRHCSISTTVSGPHCYYGRLKMSNLIYALAASEPDTHTSMACCAHLNIDNQSIIHRRQISYHGTDPSTYLLRGPKYVFNTLKPATTSYH